MNLSTMHHAHQPQFGKIIITDATGNSNHYSLDVTLTDEDKALKPQIPNLPDHFRIIPNPTRLDLGVLRGLANLPGLSSLKGFLPDESTEASAGNPEDEIEIRWQSNPIGNYDKAQTLTKEDRGLLAPLVAKMSQRKAEPNQAIVSSLSALNGLDPELGDTMRFVTPVAEEMARYPNVTFGPLEHKGQRFYPQYFRSLQQVMNTLVSWVNG